MFGISKRGNPLRKLLIHGARFMRHAPGSISRRIGGMGSGMHVNNTVALAAKIARIAWVILNRPGALYQRREPAAA